MVAAAAMIIDNDSGDAARARSLAVAVLIFELIISFWPFFGVRINGYGLRTEVIYCIAR